jgi:hypothetical protein
MDVSSNRCVIAALLDGRMGMTSECHHNGKTEHEGLIEEIGDSSRQRSDSLLYVLSRVTELFDAIDVRSDHQDVNLWGVDDH